MARRLLTAMCAISTAACILTIALGVRGRNWDDELCVDSYKADGGIAIKVRSLSVFSDGHIGFSYEHFTPNADLPADDPLHGLKGAREEYRMVWNSTSRDNGKWWPASWWNRLGFRFEDGLGSGVGAELLYLAIPYWFIAGSTGMVALVTGWKLFHVRRRLRGHCSNCGYDLRASANRCPECGTPITLAL